MSAFKFGFCDWMLPLTGLSSLYLAAELGYDGVQYIYMDDPATGQPMRRPAVQRLLRETTAKTGVAIHLLMLHSIAQQGKIKCRPETEAGREGLDAVRQAAEDCRAMGVKRLLLYSFFASQIQNQADLENTAAFLQAAGEMTRDAGVALVYESFSPLAETLELHERSGGAFKLCYDTLNPVINGFGDPLAELPRYLERDMVDSIHLKDMPDAGPGFAPLGGGCGQYKACTDILREYNYAGWLVCENMYATDDSANGDLAAQMHADLDTMRQDFH